MMQNQEKAYGASIEKIQSIFDNGTFVELGAYTKRFGSDKEYEGVVCGYGAVNGKLVFAFLQESDREKGAFSDRQSKKIIDTYALAVKNGAPIIENMPSGVSYEGENAEFVLFKVVAGNYDFVAK